MEAGRFRIDVETQFHPLTRIVHDDDYLSFSELTDRNPRAAEHGDAEFQAFQIDLVPRYAAGDRTEVFLSIPYRRLTVRVDHEDEHHRNQTMEGLGDVRLGVRHYLLATESSQVALSLGIRLPAGRRNRVTAASYLGHEEAKDLGVDVPEHSHLRLGTGTVDPFLGVEVLHRLGPRAMVFGIVQADLPFAEDSYGYRTSPSATLVVGPAWRIGESRWVFLLFGEASYTGRDRFRGGDVTGPGGVFDGALWVPNTGRFEAALRPGVVWSASDRWTVSVQARAPLYTRIREDGDRRDVQLAEPVGVQVGVSYAF